MKNQPIKSHLIVQAELSAETLGEALSLRCQHLQWFTNTPKLAPPDKPEQHLFHCTL